MSKCELIRQKMMNNKQTLGQRGRGELALITPLKQGITASLDCDTGMPAYKRAKLSLEARVGEMGSGSGRLLSTVAYIDA